MINALDLYRQYQDSQSEREARRSLAELAQRKFEAEQQMMPGQMEGQRLSNLGKVSQMSNQQEVLRRQAIEQQSQQQGRQAQQQYLRDALAAKERMGKMAAEARMNQLAKPPVGYRMKPDGSMEAVPGGPADLKAQADAQKKATGAEDVDIALGTLRDAYGRLEEGGGITSTKNSALGNVIPSAASSWVGQTLGKTFGTNNQSARNDISMARPALLAALMKATGMSAKQMDSNAELKLWLSTATDPTLDVESNRRALDNIEKKYIGNRSPSGPKAPDAKSRKVVRTGTRNGKRVVQYEDGSIEEAQ